jgi:hypothetical protein
MVVDGETKKDRRQCPDLLVYKPDFGAKLELGGIG